MDIIDFKENNVVICDESYVSIDNICGDFYYLCSGSSVQKDKLSGIPLSKEILDKSNVSFSQVGQELKGVFDSISIYINLQTGRCRITDSINTNNDKIFEVVSYVHHLQNIIYKHIGSRLIFSNQL